PAGTCGLHAQGDTGPGDNWFTVQNRPDDQRPFLIVMNTTGQAQSVTVTYPHEDRGRAGDAGVRTPVALAPFGTALSEIVLPDALGEEIGARPFSVRARAEGACRVYLVCATPALDRFSIDHR
ncbi:MAG: hypothetical protein CMM31_00440, partial [Rhodospirillaceae bacterium]|nr:hypothetical protein [Rhodospirillaceae bacterium]